MTWPSTPTGWPHPGDGPGTRACDVCQQCVTIPLQNILGYHYSGTEIHRHKRVRRFLDSLSYFCHPEVLQPFPNIILVLSLSFLSST